MATKKKPVTKSNAKKTKGTSQHRSLVVSNNTTPFFTFRITQQTFYWFALSILVLALGIWVLTLTVKIQQIYDDIDTLQSQTLNTDTSSKKKE